MARIGEKPAYCRRTRRTRKTSKKIIRAVAQSGSAFDWGSKGRWFESSRPDLLSRNVITSCGFLHALQSRGICRANLNANLLRFEAFSAAHNSSAVCFGVAPDVVPHRGFNRPMPHQLHESFGGMTRSDQRSPKLRRRSWADANLTFPAADFWTTTLAALPMRRSCCAHPFRLAAIAVELQSRQLEYGPSPFGFRHAIQ